MDKHHLRSRFKQKRQELSAARYQQDSLRIWNRLRNYLRWNELKTIHTYLSMADQREVSTTYLLDYVWHHYPHIEIVVPVVKSESELVHCKIEANAELKPNVWGIPEPVEKIFFNIDQLQVVIVPLLTFDRAGHRLGYGKGHYDRFLVMCPSDTEKIGLSLFPPIDQLAIAHTDVALDTVITPQKIYHFGSLNFG